MLRQATAILSLTACCLVLQPIVAVVNIGETASKIEKTTESSANDSQSAVTDSIAESSDTADRRDAPILPLAFGVPSLSVPSLQASQFDAYLPPPSDNGVLLPVPVYGVPNSLSQQNIVYPSPPPDVPPPAYGLPAVGNTYGLSTLNALPLVSKDTYGPPPPSRNYGVRPFSINLIPPKPTYGLPKFTSSLSTKPLKIYNKYPKPLGLKTPPKPVYGSPSKPVYGAPFSYNNFKFNKNNQFYTGLNTNTISSHTYSLPNLYKDLSNSNYQYGLPVKPPTISFKYGVPKGNIGLSTQYGVPEKFTTAPTYSPPQLPRNPKPPHPGIPAPPTPPDIKYDGWQPIPGLISKPPIKEASGYTLISHNGYNDMLLPTLDHFDAIPNPTYGVSQLPLPSPPSSVPNSITLNVESSHSNEHLLNFNEGKVITDSYNAPLGTVTGSGGVISTVAQHGQHGLAAAHSTAQKTVDHAVYAELSQNSQYNSETQSIKSNGPQIYPQISNSYEHHQPSTTLNQVSTSHQNNINDDNPSVESSIGSIPPSKIYGAPPTSNYGNSLYTTVNSEVINYESLNNQDLSQDISSVSYPLVARATLTPSTSYGVPDGGSGALSYQTLVQGSSPAGLSQQDNELHIEGASALPLTNGASYSGIPSASGESISVGLDYSHPPVTIDFTPKANPINCTSAKQSPVPPLAYGPPAADSYSSSLSSLTTNIGTSHNQPIRPQSIYVAPFSEYGAPDLLHSSSKKIKTRTNSENENIEDNQGKTYGQSVADSFGPNTELVQSQSIDLNNIRLQGNLDSYTLQIQSSDGSNNKLPHNQILHEGLLQSILQAIEEPKQKNDNKYPIILQSNINLNNLNASSFDVAQSQPSEIKEVIVGAPINNHKEDEVEVEEKKDVETNVSDDDDEEMLQLLDNSNIALYYRTNNGVKEVKTINESENGINSSNSN